ncbi:hypothetical protein FFLO_05768 [Filobasidium floriforme]|uniref:Aspartate aminotransferase n=1 Tax=Filobasidium floriforme TaxID=5210 RepID=A0A8K0JGD7_9TREE|nr:hypothetical protein FFLO_05768 [Filobasidium floriforme]
MLTRSTLTTTTRLSAVATRSVRAASFWSQVPQGPADPILGVSEAFKADKSSKKINLGVGAYRDGNGKPYVLPSVLEAEKRLFNGSLDKEYLPITGLGDFTKLSAELAYGKDSKPIKEGRVAVAQSISGTGALRIGTAFLARFYPHAKAIYLPSPSWGNHTPIAKDSGLEVKQYTYFDKETVGLNFEGMKKDIQNAPNNSIILLHACAHNPTGIDPTHEQWKELSNIFKEKGHFPFFDMAYQGFASGDIDYDAFALRHFVSEGHQPILTQSFAKNMGLYGERAGAFSIVCNSAEEKAKVDSQIKILIRPLYSNPPVHGARLVSAILGDEQLRAQWLTEVKGMADRIIDMRHGLQSMLEDMNTPGSWKHISNQIGMFSFTGLKAEAVDALAANASIYMTRDGRISMAGLNKNNLEYFAENVSKAVKGELGDSTHGAPTKPPKGSAPEPAQGAN